MHIFHKWGKWRLADGGYRNAYGMQFLAKIQWRVCSVCGRRQLK